jgi:hypothetical protein
MIGSGVISLSHPQSLRGEHTPLPVYQLGTRSPPVIADEKNHARRRGVKALQGRF